MDHQTEQKIRERAYEIWLEAGRTHGLDLEHWAKAERDVAVTRKPAAGASAKKPAVEKVSKAKTTALVAKPATDKAKSAKKAKANPDATNTLWRTKVSMAEVCGTLN